MNVKETLLFPGWWKFVVSGAIAGIALAYLTGCTTPVEAEPEYPQYDKWWTAYPVEEHVDSFGIRTYTQPL